MISSLQSSSVRIQKYTRNARAMITIIISKEMYHLSSVKLSACMSASLTLYSQPSIRNQTSVEYFW